MTTISPIIGHLSPSRTPGTRIWRVVRLNIVNKRNIVWIPLFTMFMILLINIAIWVIITASTAPGARASALEGTQYAGGGFFIFIFMLISGVQIITTSFPFALGLSVTRRDFFLGSSATFVLLSAIYAVGFGLFSLAETATKGWFVGGHLFTTIYFGTNVAERMLVVFLGLLFCFFVGAVGGTLYMRWRVIGLVIAGACLAIVLVGLFALITLTASWARVGDGFVSAGPLGVAAWTLVPVAVAAAAGYLALRGATPKD